MRWTKKSSAKCCVSLISSHIGFWRQCSRHPTHCTVVSNPVYFQLSTSRPKYLLKALPVLLKIISFKREWAVSYRWITVGISVSISQSHTEPIMPKDLTLNHLIYSLSALVYRNLFHVLALLLFSPVQRPPQGTLLYRKTDQKKENLSGMCTCVKILCLQIPIRDTIYHDYTCFWNIRTCLTLYNEKIYFWIYYQKPRINIKDTYMSR